MPKGWKSKRRKLAKSRSAEAEAQLAKGNLVFLPRVQIIARQIDASIHLWFQDFEAVSVHVLAAGAHRNLREIGQEIGKGPVLADSVGGENRLYLAFDAFRHGISDVDFAPWTTQSLLHDAIVSFEKIYRFRTAHMTTFGTYIILKTTLAGEGDNEPFFEGLLIKDVRNLSAQEFFAKMLPLFARSEPVIRLGVSGHTRAVGFHLP